METALVTENKIPTMISVKTLTEEEKAVLKSTVAKGTTDTELAYFLTVSASQSLDPWKKEVWCIKRAKKGPDGIYDYKNADLVIMTGRDGYLKLAKKNPNFRKIQSVEVRENDEFSVNPVTEEVIHSFKAKERGAIIGAYAVITDKDGVRHFKYVPWNEYNDTYSPVWKNKPSAMICKCAESVLCRQYANVSGIVAEEIFDKESRDVDSSPEKQQQASKDKDDLISKIQSCKTIEELDEAAKQFASDLGRLQMEDRSAVMKAGKQRRKELTDEYKLTPDVVDAEVVQSDSGDSDSTTQESVESLKNGRGNSKSPEPTLRSLFQVSAKPVKIKISRKK